MSVVSPSRSCFTYNHHPHTLTRFSYLSHQTTGSQSFLETIASSSSPSDPHLPLTVFDLVRTECLGSLYGMLALALHGLGIVEEEAEEDEEFNEMSKSSSFSEPVISSAAATTHVDPSILLPRVASMVVSGSEDESDGKEYSRPSVPADRRDDDEDGGEEEEMSLTANSRARGDPSHLCITLPCKMPLGQDVTVSFFIISSYKIERNAFH